MTTLATKDLIKLCDAKTRSFSQNLSQQACKEPVIHVDNPLPLTDLTLNIDHGHIDSMIIHRMANF